MANKKVIIADICINDESKCCVFSQKEAMNNYLYALAIRNWPAAAGVIPTRRAAVIDAFFNNVAGNSCTSTPGTHFGYNLCRDQASQACAHDRRRRQQVKCGVGSH